MEFHVQVVRCTAGGGYFIWERSGQSAHGGVPCTGGEMYGMRRIHSLGKIRSEHSRWSSMYVQVVRCTAGRGYIIWERLGQSTHGGEIHV